MWLVQMSHFTLPQGDLRVQSIRSGEILGLSNAKEKGFVTALFE
jgi:hypothetical protein